MTTELIHVELTGTSILTTDEAKEIASNLHTELAALTLVNSPATQAAATDKARNAQSFLKRLEADRKAVKAPVLELGRKIDTLADDLAAPVKTEMNRVGALVAKFQTAEAARVEAERRDREAKERAAMQAKFEADRLAREAEAKLTNEADLQKAIEAEEEAKRKESLMYAELTKPQPVAVKAVGSATTPVLRYEVLDIKVAFAAAPHLFSVEIKPSAVNATCNADTVIPGMRFWSELTTSFRSR
jgi:hypothetical protein